MSSGRRAKKSLGQHFLMDPTARRRIVEALEAGPGDEVVEIGPGQGALTELLVGKVGRLVAIELDDGLAADLEARWGAREDFHLVHRDVLEVAAASLVGDPDRYLLVGNLPYGITGPVMGRILERPRARRAVIMVQAEVGDRILAEPGSKTYGALTVGVGAVFGARRVARVPRGAFRPVPGVDSVVVRLDRLDPPLVAPEEEERFRNLVRAAFQWRRKQLGTILARHPDLESERPAAARAAEELGIDLRTRPEAIAPGEFVQLLRGGHRLRKPRVD